MNVLSQAINNGIYPKKMVVSKTQITEIVRDFHTRWEPCLDLLDDQAYCVAFYMTRTGEQKRCVMIWDID